MTTAALTPDQIRSRRAREVAGATVNLRAISRTRLAVVRAHDPDALARHLPATRAECIDAPRPCPYVSCRHHLFLDATQRGSIRFNFPDLLSADDEPDLDAMPATCALDEAERDGMTLQEVGVAMNLTRERVRQIEDCATVKLRRRER